MALLAFLDVNRLWVDDIVGFHNDILGLQQIFFKGRVLPLLLQLTCLSFHATFWQTRISIRFLAAVRLASCLGPGQKSTETPSNLLCLRRDNKGSQTNHQLLVLALPGLKLLCSPFLRGLPSYFRLHAVSSQTKLET